MLAAFGLQPRPVCAPLARALCGRSTSMPARPPLDVACLPCGPSEPIRVTFSQRCFDVAMCSRVLVHVCVVLETGASGACARGPSPRPMRGYLVKHPLETLPNIVPLGYATLSLVDCSRRTLFGKDGGKRGPCWTPSPGARPPSLLSTGWICSRNSSNHF